MSFIKSLINITENVITTITVLYGNLCLHDDIGVLYAHSFMLECLKSFYIKKKNPTQNTIEQWTTARFVVYMFLFGMHISEYGLEIPFTTHILNLISSWLKLNLRKHKHHRSLVFHNFVPLYRIKETLNIYRSKPKKNKHLKQKNIKGQINSYPAKHLSV